MSQQASANDRFASIGHLGTHFDVMDKEFPLEFLRREAVVFDVRGAGEEIDCQDLDLSLVHPGAFVALHSGAIESLGYGTKPYFAQHPQLTPGLIEALLDQRVSIIGVDFAGIRRNPEHTPMDQYCADRGAFIVENLCNLGQVLAGAASRRCSINTYPIKFAGLTGLPCRVVAELP